MLIALNDKMKNKVVGVVEVCLEAPDGKLAPAVAMRVPWRAMKDYHEPYLCNLCVDNDYRRQGLGLVLCQLAEQIVVKYWLKTVMYLHVEVSNIAAQNLYSKMGYELGPQLPSWERKLHGERHLTSLSLKVISSQVLRIFSIIGNISSRTPLLKWTRTSVLMQRKYIRRWPGCIEDSRNALYTEENFAENSRLYRLLEFIFS